MTRTALDNWDGHLSKLESHKPPQPVGGPAFSPPPEDASSTGDSQRSVLFSPNSRPSGVDETLDYACSGSRYPPDDASNEHPELTIPHPFAETRLFYSSDFSDTDPASDIVTDALNPPATDNNPRSRSVFGNGTRCSPFPISPQNPETLVPSPTLTVHTISTYSADAHGEEEDDDVIIVDHVQDKPSSEAHDSLFTPPPSELGDLPSPSKSPPPLDHGKKSPIVPFPVPRRIRMVASHVLLPKLSKPKSEYIRLSSLMKPARKRPHRSAQDHFKEVLNAVRENDESLGWLGEDGDSDSDGRRKKRKRKHKRLEGSTHPVAGPSQPSHNDEQSVIFVSWKPIVKHPTEERSHPAETAFIDLTLDDDDVKPLDLLSSHTHSITQPSEVTSPNPQPASGETRIRIGVVHSISYKTLLHNTRFLRHTKGDTVPHKDFVMLGSLLPVRRRRALLDNLEGSSLLVDEFSLGSPVLTEFGMETVDEDDSDEDGSVYDVIEILDSPSETPAPKPVFDPPPPTLVKPLACPPKIDLAAKYRKKKNAASRRTAAMTPVRNTASTLTSSSSRKRPVHDVVMDDDSYIPSAKALGKRKAVESPLQALQVRPDQSSFPSYRTAESLAADNSFDSYINYWPASPGRPMIHNPSLALGAYAYPDPYSNFPLSSVPNLNLVDPRHPYPNPNLEPPPPTASLLYHADEYNGTPDNYGRFTGSVLGDPPPSESTMLPSWSPELDTGFQYDNGTVNPSLLGGGPLGMSEQPPESYFSDLGNDLLDPDKPESSFSMMSPTHSPSRSASPVTLSSSPKPKGFHQVHVHKNADSDTIFVRPRRPPSPNDSKRRHVKRSMPDMVPSTFLGLSSSSSSSSSGDEEETDDKSKRRSTKHRGGGRRLNSSSPVPPKRKSHPTVSRKAATILPSGPKVMIGGQLWPMQDEPAYCHQCRNKTTVLKLNCDQCNKAYCIRCLTLRYPDDPRALQMIELGCPGCLEYCNCTNCCRKRGVQYISTKDALAGGVASRAQLKAQKKSSSGGSYTSSLSPVPELGAASTSRQSSALPLTPTGGEYWGVIYGADGSKIGTGFSFAKEDVRPRRAPAVPTNGVYWGVIYGADGSKIGQGYTFAKEDVGRIVGTAAPVSKAVTTTARPRSSRQRRVYVGKIHPSWQFDGAVKKSVLNPVPPPKRVHESRRPRKYVGNKAFLFYKSEKMARELADLSPLSSLEEDWEEEDRGMGVEREVEDDEGNTIAGSEREASNEGSDSSTSLSDEDVMRAIGLGLHACGIQLAG